MPCKGTLSPIEGLKDGATLTRENWNTLSRHRHKSENRYKQDHSPNIESGRPQLQVSSDLTRYTENIILIAWSKVDPEWSKSVDIAVHKITEEQVTGVERAAVGLLAFGVFEEEYNQRLDRMYADLDYLVE
ncbi:hypothetical protein TWF696_003746 [Orbilia brochopaga]|uniref:Uncharacterized protein n=1 Tax=Orbilia brochopaga TaxID=3140254 RepID=A0AAV9V592_9PEZI